MTKFVRGLDWERILSPEPKSLNIGGPSKCENVKQTLDGFTEELGSLFPKLRSTARELLATGCQKSWIFALNAPWGPMFHIHWGPLQLPGAMNRFRARLLGETILMQLEVARLMGKDSSPELGQGVASRQMSRSIQKIRPMVESASASVQAFVEKLGVDRHPSLFMSAMKDLSFLQPEHLSTIQFNLSDLREKAEMLWTIAHNDSTLKPKAIESFKEAYNVAKQLVQSYATVLHQAKEQFDGGARDKVLLILFADIIVRENLVLAKSTMEYAEALKDQLKLGVLPYNWDEFPLNHNWFQVTAEGEESPRAPEQSLLTKRGEIEGREEPKGKRDRLSDDEE